jgi:hypothetical protein
MERQLFAPRLLGEGAEFHLFQLILKNSGLGTLRPRALASLRSPFAVFAVFAFKNSKTFGHFNISAPKS